jgi:nucleotide-binding universal stress UspA family protein
VARIVLVCLRARAFEEIIMSSSNPFVIVVGTDFSELAGKALDQALQVATLHDSADVHVVHVDPWTVGALETKREKAVDVDTALRGVQKIAAEHVKAMPAHLNRARIRRVVAHFRSGSPAQDISQLAADLDADLVVVGSHGHHGLERFFLGSVAERVSRLARCPVWIVRPKDYSTAGRVPEIEPACPDCLAKRAETGGVDLWCARHSEHHLRPHRYSYVSDGIFSAETTPYEFLPERGA